MVDSPHAPPPHFKKFREEATHRTEALLKVARLRPVKPVGPQRPPSFHSVFLILNGLINIGEFLTGRRIRLPDGPQTIHVHSVICRPTLGVLLLGIVIYPEITQLREPVRSDALINRKNMRAESPELI